MVSNFKCWSLNNKRIIGLNLALCFVAAILIITIPNAGSAEEFLIKQATLAPEGTTWIDIMLEGNKEIQEKSGGRIKYKLFPGASKGDEKDVVRKMRLGDIQSAGMTGVGLAEILPEIHVLDLALMFESNDEVDYVYEKIFDHFHKAFAEKGFEFLGFAEVGFVYMYSTQKIITLDDMRKSKVWSWEGDPLILTLMEEANITPVPLALPDVNTSLQTGLLQTVYGPPLGIVAFQWFTKLKYMNENPLAHGCGGVIVTKKIFDKLPPDLQQLTRDVTKKLARKLTDMTRKQNIEAIGTLKEHGLELVPPPSPEVFKEFEDLALRVRTKLVGKMYSKELLDQVLSLRDEFRATKGAQTAGAK